MQIPSGWESLKTLNGLEQNLLEPFGWCLGDVEARYWQRRFLTSASVFTESLLPSVCFDVVQSGFAANGYEAHSPGGYSLFAALVCEIVMIYVILVVILGGATHRRAL